MLKRLIKNNNISVIEFIKQLNSNNKNYQEIYFLLTNTQWKIDDDSD